MIYKIKYNTYTKTYYVYRYQKPTLLIQSVSKSMRDFMDSAEKKLVYNFMVWEKK